MGSPSPRASQHMQTGSKRLSRQRESRDAYLSIYKQIARWFHKSRRHARSRAWRSSGGAGDAAQRQYDILEQLVRRYNELLDTSDAPQLVPTYHYDWKAASASRGSTRSDQPGADRPPAAGADREHRSTTGGESIAH